METLMQQHTNGLQNSRVLIYLIATFAFLALFFGGSGLFAVVSQAVSQRLPEIGLRMALGASTANIERWVLSSGFRLLALGAVLGLGLGMLLGSLLAKQMVRVAPYDWQVILPSALLFVAVGIAACAVPALRAARTDITRVIRQD
jgi:ABC-type antimicrobial peptide transport system permease subunit